MKVSATAKFVGTSSRKIGLVAGLIRGLSVADAERMLLNTAKGATTPMGKVLKSALANAENNANLKKNDLIVESVLVGPGPTIKRFRPRARGSAGKIAKRSSHITVVLNDQKLDGAPKLTPAAPVTKTSTTKPQTKGKATSGLPTETNSKPEVEKK